MLAKGIMSAMFGLLYGVLGYAALRLVDAPDAPRQALAVGLTAFGVCLLLLLLHERWMNRRYARAEALLPGAPLGCLDVNLREGQKIAAHRVYLLEWEICLVCVEKRRPVLTRLGPGEIRRATFVARGEMHLALEEGRTLRLLSVRMDELIRHLRRMGVYVGQEMA